MTCRLRVNEFGLGATISYGIDWTNRNQMAGITRYSDASLTTKIGIVSEGGGSTIGLRS